jgi:hypothetical protein
MFFPHPNKCSGRVSNTPASYSSSSDFKSRTGDRLLGLRILGFHQTLQANTRIVP